MNILLVDDDYIERQYVHRTLKESTPDISITEACTVNEALLYFKEGIYDVILLDHKMPDRDGLEMVLEIRSKFRGFDTAIVMVSNNEDEDLALNYLKKGSQDFLVKSEITAALLRRAILKAKARIEIERKLLASYKKAKKLAETDFLTGLPNRYLFDESLKIAILNNTRKQFKLALLLIDLDNFKHVNDTFGHDVGDILLKKTVMRIRGCLRGHELFARLGGDEFAIMLCNLKSIESTSAVVRRIIQVMVKPFEIAGRNFKSSASIGIAIHPDNGSTSEVLFKQTDIAMYRAKLLGRNRACFFEEEMQATFAYRIKIEEELKHAQEKQQFELYFQPILNPKDKRLCGFEALLRWNIGNEIRSPAGFVMIAEEIHQIIPVERWVIDEAISTLALWNKKNNTNYFMAINISSAQLADRSIVTVIEQSLMKHQVDSRLIEIELTETALLVDTEEAKNVLDELHDIGCHISLDDFGTGFSSISHLKNYPIDSVKIDKNLISRNKRHTKKNAFVKALVAMADVLGLAVIAEGIETPTQESLCLSLGIKRVQGFFYSKPLNKASIEKCYLN